MLNELEIDAFTAQKSTFDLLIDARSPKEFHESHIPNAHNFYALNDAEHQEVGTLYKHISRNDAKVLGAHYICCNVAMHLLSISKQCKIGSKIGIYCARGGLRSSSIAIILSHIGYQVYRLKGGYKSYRLQVITYLENIPHHRFILLGGNTGCGKSELLQHLKPSIDLEKFANHLGSSFGSIKGEQPSQKSFENNLCEALKAIDSHDYIFIEAESKRMGTITLPARLHDHMKKSFRIEVTAPIEQRVQRILKEYTLITPLFFQKAMTMIAPYIKKSVKEATQLAYEDNNLEEVARILLVEYYDLVYRKPPRVDCVIDNADQTRTLQTLEALHVKLTLA